jgi:hypothetical protein
MRLYALKAQRPNPPPLPKYHTIHLRESKKPFVFHIHDSKNDPSRTFLVCFRDLDMAKQMVHLIRIHYAIHGDWPSTHIYPEEPLELLVPKEASEKEINLKLEIVPKIWIRTWKEDELEQFSIASLLHLFQIEENNTVQMYRFDYDLETLKTYFEEQWK